MLAPIIDDAHLMDVSALRRIRLLFEDFPKSHCLVLVAQPELLSRLALTVNEDIKIALPELGKRSLPSLFLKASTPRFSCPS